jgi:hypothetical protein
MQKITTKKVLQFLEGNIKMLGDKFNLLKNHEKEQVLWRLELCKNDCVVEGKCKYCGCSVPGKLYVKKSCNEGIIFPDMMDEWEWQEWKRINNIDIKNENNS